MEDKKTQAPYETLFILRSEHVGKVKEFVDKFRKVIVDLGATVTHVEEWGIRDLAYPIQKQRKGHYSLMQYRASPGTVEELERNMKISEGVMRFLTVRLDEVEEDSSPRAPEELPQGASGESGKGLNDAEPES